MATGRQPAEVFPPGSFLREELEERGWTQEDLAAIMGKDQRTVNEIVVGKRGVTPESAKALAAALGTTPEFWLNLDSAYKLWRLQADDSDVVARRARLYTIAPFKDMVRRGWIEPSSNLNVLEAQVMSFFCLTSLSDTPSFGTHAARKSTSYEHITPAQSAWLFRALHLSEYVHAESYSSSRLDDALNQLKQLMHSPQESRHVPRILGEAGIKLVVVEQLPGTKIDGATFWLDASPVIAISIRFDRIDNFWFTLLHELAHVAQGSSSLDIEIDDMPQDAQLPDVERQANIFAAEQTVPQAELDSLVARVSPMYSTNRIQGFAMLHGLHPGIVVGQLHHRGEVAWSNFRRLLVPTREYVTQSAVTDGWGTTLPVLPTQSGSR